MKYLFLFLILMSPFSFSANEAIPKDRTITELRFYDDAVIVRMSPAYVNSQECTSSSNHWLQLGYDDQTGENKAMLTSLLTAAAAGKKVGFGIGGCEGQYPKIYRVDVLF